MTANTRAMMFLTRGLCAALVLSSTAVALLARAGQKPNGTQGPRARSVTKPRPLPRMADGHPDLQAIWDFRSPVPLERPAELAGKESLTEAEAVEYRRRRLEAEEKRAQTSPGLLVGYDRNVWWDNGWDQLPGRTSLIVDPRDGRLPPLTPAAQKRVAEAAEPNEIAAGPEDRWLSERCMVGFNAGPPIMPSDYNNNLQIFQTPNTIGLLTEMIHEARIVHLDGRPAVGVRQWAGNSRGWWEGDTLVVDTTNFLEKTNLPGRPTGFSWRRNISDKGSAKLHVVERFLRTDFDTLVYEFTVDDPDTYAAPWTARVEMKRTTDQIFEYACHEGNMSMFGILSAARAVERAKANRPAGSTSTNR